MMVTTHNFFMVRIMVDIILSAYTIAGYPPNTGRIFVQQRTKLGQYATCEGDQHYA